MGNTMKRFFAAGAAALSAGAATLALAATDIANIASGTRALPAGYTQLEYAQTKGGDVRVNTGAATDYSGRIEAKVSFGSVSKDSYIWGVYCLDSTKMFTFGCIGGKMQIAYSQQTVSLPTAPVANEPYLVTIDYGRKSYSVVRMSTGEAQTGTLGATADTALSNQIQIFAANGVKAGSTSGSYQKSAASGSRVYYFRYYNASGTALLDLVPAKNASNEVVFYDAVSQAQKARSGTALVAGPSIMAVDGNTPLAAAKTVDKLMIASGATLDQNGQTFSAAAVATFPADVPAGFTRLASLHVNSNVVFKTQYKPGASDMAEIKVKFTDRLSDSAQVLFGARSAKNGNKNAMTFWHWWDATDCVRFDYGKAGPKKMVTELSPPLQSIETGRDYIFSLKNGEALVKDGDGQMLADYSGLMEFASVADNASYMWLLGFIDGATTSNSTSSGIQYYACSTDFYWFKATDGSSVKCHFVPVRRESDGAVGVYDLTGRFGFVAPSIAAGGAVAAGAAVAPSAAGLALSSDVSITDAVSASVPLAIAKSGEAQSDITVAVPGTLSGAGGIAVGGGVTLDVGLNRVENSKLSFETGSAIALRLASLADEPVIHNVANEPPVVAVYGVDGTTLLDNAVATYDATERTLSVTVPSSYVWTNASGDGSFEDLGNWSGGRLPGANDTFEIVVAADTAINVSDAHAMGYMVVKGGHEVAFSGAGSLSVLSATVEQDTTLATGGVVLFGAFGGDGSIVYSPGAADALAITGASTLGGDFKIATDKSIAVTVNAAVSAGTFTVAGAANSVVTMSCGTGGSFVATGGATVQSGVLKQGSAGVLGATPTLTVENGGTFDFNMLNPNAATSYVLAGAGAGNWPWAMTSTGGTPDDYVKNITLADDATIGSSAGSQLKVGCYTDPGVANRGNLTLNGHTLTVAGEMWITWRYINTPGAGTIYYSSRGTAFYPGALNNQGGETTLVLGEGCGISDNENIGFRVYNATTAFAFDWRGGDLATSAALTIGSALAVSGGDKQTARLSFADGAAVVLSNNLAVTNALTANGALSLSKAQAAEDSVTLSAAGTLSAGGTITVGEGVIFDIGTNRPEGTLNIAAGAGLKLKLASATESPVLHVASDITTSLTVLDVDGNEVADFESAYDSAAGTLTLTCLNVWRATGDSGSFETPANWSKGAMPRSGEPFIVEVTDDTQISVSGQYELGEMQVRGGGTAEFSGNGSMAVTTASVAQGATLATGGVVSFGAFGGDGSIVYSPGAADALAITGASTLGGDFKIATDKSIAVTVNAAVSAGTFTVAGAADCVVALTNGTGGSFVATGGATVKSGVLQQRSANALGATPRLTVEAGGTFDINAMAIRQETPVYIAGAGAGEWQCALTSSSGSMAKGNYIYNLYLTDDATVAGEQLKLGADDTASVIRLDGHTLTVKCWVTFRNINTDAGTIDLYNSITLYTWNNLNTDSNKYSGTTVKLHSPNKIINKTNRRIFVTNLEMYGGEIDYETQNFGFGVLSTLSGFGTVKDMEFKYGAKLKPSGTDCVKITEALTIRGEDGKAGGNLAIELPENLSGSRFKLFRVGKEEILPSEEKLDIAIPSAWDLEKVEDEDGFGYDLKKRPGLFIKIR